MDPSHAAKAVYQPRLFRLGELIARAGARQRREQAIVRLVSDGKEEPAADPVGALFQTQGDLSIGEVMNLTSQPRTTVHRRLVELVETGGLVRRGQGRASRYNPLRNLK